jgi:hypothetical protein
MTNQKEAFEKWYDDGNNDPLPTDYEILGKRYLWMGWQAAQADQADEIKELQVDISRLKRALEMGGELYRHTVAQLQLDNDTLRKALESVKNSVWDAVEISTETIKNQVSSQSESQPESVVLNNQTAQKPLSGMTILEIAIEYRLDVIMSDAINFARAIEKRIRTGE